MNSGSFSQMSSLQKWLVSKGVFTWDRDELGPLCVRITLHTILFMHLHGTDLKMNSDWSDFVSVWPNTSYFCTDLRLNRSHVKQKQIADQVHK